MKVSAAAFALLVVLAFLPSDALAQTDDSIEMKATVGASGFLDESTDWHSVIGGSVRFPLSGRWSLEPQFLYMKGSGNHYDLYVIPNLTYDFETRGTATPYAVVGVGLVWSRWGGLGPAPGATFTSTNLSFGGGVGVRLRLSDRWVVTPEARIGFEPIFQFTGSVGYRF